MADLDSDFFNNTGEAKTYKTVGGSLTPIQRFFNGSKIFITGGTGFLGILLIEKLLTSCPNISKIFMLVRNKKGKDVEARMEKFFEDDIFSRLRNQCPNFREKIVVVRGDCELPQLGISKYDKELLIREVDVIFHSAATVRFDEALKKASMINVRAVRDIVVLARQMPNLKSFVHVSTAFSNCIHKYIKEEIYPPAMDYKKLLKVTEALPDDVLSRITPLLLREYPNTYSFTKQIGEDVLRQEGEGLPIGIHRPSIVISTSREPLKGWTNNIYGPVGLIAAASLGILRTSPYNVELKANMVPADMVVNSIIASAWDVAEHFTKQKSSNGNIPVYNFETSLGPDLTWGFYLFTCKKYAQKYTSVKALWYPDGIPLKSYFAYIFWVFFIHRIPGAIVDAVRVCMGKPPMMIKVYRKIHEIEKMVLYFKMVEWSFDTKNVSGLLYRMSEEDRKLFYSDMKEMNWEEYLENFSLGLRVYILKDPLETIPAGRKHVQRLYWMHQLTTTAVALFSIWILWCILSLMFRTMF